MIIKVKTENLYPTLGYYPGEIKVSTWLMTQHQENILNDGKCTLSIKVGKRRKLINGKLRGQDEYYGQYYQRYTDWYFTPNNPEKFKWITGL